MNDPNETPPTVEETVGITRQNPEIAHTTEVLRSAEASRLKVLNIADEILEQVAYQLTHGSRQNATNLDKLSNTLVRTASVIERATRSGGEEDALIELLEADILPLETSAKVITQIRSDREEFKKNARTSFHETPTENRQNTLFDL